MLLELHLDFYHFNMLVHPLSSFTQNSQQISNNTIVGQKAKDEQLTYAARCLPQGTLISITGNLFKVVTSVIWLELLVNKRGFPGVNQGLSSQTSTLSLNDVRSDSNK